MSRLEALLGKGNLSTALPSPAQERETQRSKFLRRSIAPTSTGVSSTSSAAALPLRGVNSNFETSAFSISPSTSNSSTTSSSSSLLLLPPHFTPSSLSKASTPASPLISASSQYAQRVHGLFSNAALEDHKNPQISTLSNTILPSSSFSSSTSFVPSSSSTSSFTPSAPPPAAFNSSFYHDEEDDTSSHLNNSSRVGQFPYKSKDQQLSYPNVDIVNNFFQIITTQGSDQTNIEGTLIAYENACIDTIISLLTQKSQLQPYSADFAAVNQRLTWTRAERSAWNLLRLLFIDEKHADERQVAARAIALARRQSNKENMSHMEDMSTTESDNNGFDWILEEKQNLMEKYLAREIGHGNILRSLFRTDSLFRRYLVIVYWLESMASDALQSEEAASLEELMHNASQTNGWEYTLHHLKHLKHKLQHKSDLPLSSTTPVVGSLDPDGPIREKKQLLEEDSQREKQVLKLVFSLIRFGKYVEAQSLCKESGYSWRAVTLGNPSLWLDASIVLRLNLSPENEPDPEVSSTRAVWLSACAAAAKDPRLSSLERSIYASFIGDIPHTLENCVTWEDWLWAHFKSLVLERVEQEYCLFVPLSSVDPDGVPYEDDLFYDTNSSTTATTSESRLNKREELTHQRFNLSSLSTLTSTSTSTSAIAGQGKSLSKHASPAPEDILKKINTMSSAQIRETAAGPFHQALSSIVLNDVDELVLSLASVCFKTQEKLTSIESLVSLTSHIQSNVLSSLAQKSIKGIEGFDHQHQQHQQHQHDQVLALSSSNGLHSSHIVRFTVHLMLYLKNLVIGLDNSIIDSLLAVYIEFLVDTHRFQQVAAYTALISDLGLQVSLYAAFLQPFPSKLRHSYLTLGDQHGLDIARIAKTVVDNIRAFADSDDILPVVSSSSSSYSSSSSSISSASASLLYPASSTVATPSAPNSAVKPFSFHQKAILGKSLNTSMSYSDAAPSAPATPKTPVQFKSRLSLAVLQQGANSNNNNKNNNNNNTSLMDDGSLNTSSSSSMMTGTTSSVKKLALTPKKTVESNNTSRIMNTNNNNSSRLLNSETPSSKVTVESTLLNNRPVVSRADQDRIEAVQWLSANPAQRGEALLQTNSLLRGFLAGDKFTASEALLATMAEFQLDQLDAQLYNGMDISEAEQEPQFRIILNACHELRSLDALIHAYKSYNTWATQFASKPVAPPTFTRELYNNEHQYQMSLDNYNMRIERWQQEFSKVAEIAVECIREVLMFSKGWLVDIYPEEASESMKIDARTSQLNGLRQKFIPALSFLLHKVLHDSEQYGLALQVADVVCHRPSRLFELFTKTELQRLLNLVRESALKNLESTENPLGFY